MLGMFLTLLIAGFIGLIALGLVLTILGAILSLTFGVAILALKLAPVLLVGWIVLKLVDRGRRKRQISAADQRWLDS